MAARLPSLSVNLIKALPFSKRPKSRTVSSLGPQRLVCLLGPIGVLVLIQGFLDTRLPVWKIHTSYILQMFRERCAIYLLDNLENIWVARRTVHCKCVGTPESDLLADSSFEQSMQGDTLYNSVGHTQALWDNLSFRVHVHFTVTFRGCYYQAEQNVTYHINVTHTEGRHISYEGTQCIDSKLPMTVLHVCAARVCQRVRN